MEPAGETPSQGKSIAGGVSDPLHRRTQTEVRAISLGARDGSAVRGRIGGTRQRNRDAVRSVLPALQPDTAIGDAEIAQVRIRGRQPRVSLPLHSKKDIKMQARLSRVIGIAALALPVADAAVAAEGSIRSRDFFVVPMVPMDLGNGTSAPSAAALNSISDNWDLIAPRSPPIRVRHPAPAMAAPRSATDSAPQS
jgi:hypothetical protein